MGIASIACGIRSFSIKGRSLIGRRHLRPACYGTCEEGAGSIVRGAKVVIVLREKVSDAFLVLLRGWEDLRSSAM